MSMKVNTSVWVGNTSNQLKLFFLLGIAFGPIGKAYCITERLVTKYTRILIKTIGSILFCTLCAPFLLALFDYCRGSYSISSWKLLHVAMLVSEYPFWIENWFYSLFFVSATRGIWVLVEIWHSVHCFSALLHHSWSTSWLYHSCCLWLYRFTLLLWSKMWRR